ncbi:MAG: AraC family transcriptional regulator [Ottowia sp.]|uniref:AraC family transcriptional regulator n=1 Tax=Ottowia sp. TaxID=1898956 RepID=UPI0039E56738
MKVVLATLAEDGIPPGQALAGSGLDEAALANLATRVSYAQSIAVFRNALALARDPLVALKAGARMHVTAYGIWGYALLSSRTCADMLDFAVNYRGVIGPLAQMTHDPSSDPPSCGFRVLLTPDRRDPLYRFALEFTCAAHLTLGRDILGDAFRFSTVRMACPAPAHADAYTGFFGCQTLFDQPGNKIEFDAAWMNQPPSTQDPITHAMAREMCQQILLRLDQSGGTAARVRHALLEQMPWRFPNIDAMAEQLALEPRTLRRRLEAQGTSYRQVLAEVRCVLAVEYLQKTSMTTEEIASRLGYSDAANFRHAFVRWTGKSPQEYRRP